MIYLKIKKRLNNLKNSRRNDSILIINVTGSIDDREIEIDELSRKRNNFSNGVKRIRKKCRCICNKKVRRLEDNINTSLHQYDTKR